eukprot:6377673-Amphidinium_carterae.1
MVWSKWVDVDGLEEVFHSWTLISGGMKTSPCRYKLSVVCKLFGKQLNYWMSASSAPAFAKFCSSELVSNCTKATHGMKGFHLKCPPR